MGHAVTIDSDLLDAAADWYAQLEGDAPDYEGFATWLEANTRHRDAYDQVIALDTLATDHWAEATPMVAANDDLPASSRWKWAGAAAIVVLLVGLGALSLDRKNGDIIEVATESGQSQSVRLADASTVTLDAASAISYAKDKERKITLTKGSAYFSVNHDDAKPFTVTTGSFQIRDLGTGFSVSHAAGHLSVSVQTGSVDLIGPGITRATLKPGERIDIENGRFEKSHVDPASVGSWRQGRLVYSNAPLRLVAADINRYADRPVRVDPALSNLRFSGVLTIGDGKQLAPTLASVMGLPIRRDENNSHLVAGRAP